MAGIIWRINAPSINLSGFLLSESPSGTNSKKRGMKPETTSWTWEEIINPLTGRRHTHRTERGRGRSNGLDRIEHINNGNWSFPINYYPLQFDYEHLQSVGWRKFECKSTIKTVALNISRYPLFCWLLAAAWQVWHPNPAARNYRNCWKWNSPLGMCLPGSLHQHPHSPWYHLH